MHEVLKTIHELGIVPVVKIDNADDAVPLAKALKAGGLPIAEITFRTAAAEQAIRNIVKDVPDMLVGAGTVLTTEQADRAIQAGVKFVVTPGLSAKVVNHCQANQVPVTPGIATPTDIQAALELDLEVLKFFPAETFGGVASLKAMSAPYGMVKFIPTGGISAANLNDYLAFPKTLACGGSWMVKDDMIQAGQFDKISAMTAEAIDVMLGFELAHVGLNAADAESSLHVAKTLSGMFNMPLKEGNSSNFAGKGFEVNKRPGLGAHGHVALATHSITRAIAWLERKGIAVAMDTAKQDAAGNMVAVYLKEEIGGFAIHLLQKK